MPDPAPLLRAFESLRRCFRSGPWRGKLAWLLLFCALGCSRALCEPGLCPAGTTCDAGTGQCVQAETSASVTPALFGRTSLLRLPGGETGVVGYAPGQKSLVLLAGSADAWQASFIAGPSASSGEAPAGQASAATIDAAGHVHVAWVRSGDDSLWYATGGSNGWQRDNQPLAPPGTAGRDVAIGMWQNTPLVAWRALDISGIRVARRIGATWTIETVPTPPLPGQPNAALDLGRSLSMAMLPSGPALVSYEAAGGDLVLAVRSGTDWKVARVAGRNPTTGQDEDDVGATSALAVGPAGELAVAYRDRSHGRVMLARSKAGVLTQIQIAGGLVVDAKTGQQHVDLVGTVLAVAVLADGRAVVAIQDASNLRIDVAIQTPAGGFEHHALAGDGLQAWPSLRVAGDGSMQVGWIALQPGNGPGGALRLSQLSAGGAP